MRIIFLSGFKAASHLPALVQETEGEEALKLKRFSPLLLTQKHSLIHTQCVFELNPTRKKKHQHN